MTTEDNSQREKVINKVQALLDKAASTGFTAEAEAFRAKADELMTKFIIEEHELRMARPAAERESPVHYMFRVCERGNPIKHQLVTLASAVADYTGCRIVYHGATMSAKHYGLNVTVYGFQSDVDYFRLLLTSLQTQMAMEMEPKRPSDDLDDFEKLDVVRGCGVPWRRAFEIIGWDLTYGNKVMMEYRKARPHLKSIPPVTFIKSFAEGFCQEIESRLWALKRERERQTEQKGPGVGLMLFGRKEEINAYYEENTGNLRSYRSPEQRTVAAGVARGREAGRRADLGQSGVGNGPRGSLQSR